MTPPGVWLAGPWNTFEWNQVAPGGPGSGQQLIPPPVLPVLTGQIVVLSNSPNQSLTVTLLVDGAPLTLNLQASFNEVTQWWVLQIFDQNYNRLLSDVNLITGYWPGANLLEQYAWMRIGSLYVINTAGGLAVGDWPGPTGWGSGGFLLLWSDTPTPTL